MSTDVTTLLRGKNRCLELLVDLSEGFLKNASSCSDAVPLADRLKDFQNQRDRLFRALEIFDRRISQAVSGISPEERTPEVVEACRLELDSKTQLIQQAISADNRILEMIENEKNRVMADLASSRKSQSLMSKFKSAWVPESGEELDKTL